MNHPEFFRTIWKDPRYQALENPSKLLLFAAACQCDMAGWWAPLPRLISAEIPGLDLVKDLKELDPWVERHPTGFISLRGYVAMQIPNGEIRADSKNPFAKGMHRVLVCHQVRESKLMGREYSIEGLTSSAGPSSGALDPDPSDDKTGVEGLRRGSEAPVSTKYQAQGPEVESSSPTRGSGGATETQPVQSGDVVPLLGLFEMAGGPKAASVVVEAWEYEALDAAVGRHGWPVVEAAAAAYAIRPGEGSMPSLRAFCRAWERWIKATCTHPKGKDPQGNDQRRWWWAPLDDFSHGMIEQRWACNVCDHCETNTGTRKVRKHDHDYQPYKGVGLVVNDHGGLEEVTDPERCTLCGHFQRVQADRGVLA